ncbi:MAG: flagellar basal body P-ring protein FlgI [Candidatus Muirbacterium halophilum]|nr:flagellar basal body P-ring protein FlgI [Candidatus Muirbacterium halophilum]MCK9475716.1 flagellar basal body P-ring protein FlgI [Candidatus Muirbacterium halophilum]
MKKLIVILTIITVVILSYSEGFTVKIKDMVRFGEDNRDNQLIGYGLVGGLDGTGDKNKLAINTAINFLNNFGIVTNNQDFTTKNIAAVVVTATLPAFARSGDKLDVTISSIGDAKNLQGGVLFQTPLVGADKKVYCVAAGQVSIGGFNAGLGGAGAQKNHVTVARIPNGGIVEQEVPAQYLDGNKLKIMLKDKDFNVAQKIKKAIDEKYGRNRAKAVDPGMVEVEVPYSFMDNPVLFVTQLQNIEIVPEMSAKVIINERTGSVVINQNVKISPIAISHGNLNIQINGTDKFGNVVPLKNGNTLNDIVSSLNQMGASPRDLIAIFQMLKEAGALHAELEII